MTTREVVLSPDPVLRPAFFGYIYGSMREVAVPAHASPMFAALALDNSLFGKQGSASSRRGTKQNVQWNSMRSRWANTALVRESRHDQHVTVGRIPCVDGGAAVADAPLIPEATGAGASLRFLLRKAMLEIISTYTLYDDVEVAAVALALDAAGEIDDPVQGRDEPTI